MKKALALLLALLLLTGCGANTPQEEPAVEEPITEETVEETEQQELPRMVFTRGTLYQEYGPIDFLPKCGTMDGNICSKVERNEIPTEDGQSNFSDDFGYQNNGPDKIHVYLENEGWILFEAVK